MRTKYNRILADEGKENDFWPTFTDLLSTILLVILLVLLTVVFNKQKELTESEEILAENKEKIEEQQEMIDYLVGIEREIIEDLMLEFSETNLTLEIDPETGSIKFENDLLFETGESVIRPDFKEQLQAFIPTYFDILYGNYGDHISEIVVEGHTDDKGSFIYNLELSQNRAFSVVNYMLGDEFGDFPYKDEVRTQITANGRSKSELKYIDDTETVDRDKSRRVEFKFRLKNYSEMDDVFHVLGL